ncbi:hypothetical protein GGX14DRAFT_632450, partial [Mycena pura]
MASASARFRPLSEKILQSSYRLSPSEIGIATEIVSEGERQIADLDVAIARARIELEQLTQQREVVRKQVLEHRQAIRPVRRLPPEIVSKLLVSALPDTPHDDFADTPWYLGHICRYWRDVALAEPALWLDIFIMGADNYSIERLETQLARSSNFPLKVLFWSSLFGKTSSHAITLLQMLISRATRWTTASIVMNAGAFCHLAPLRGRIPRLHYLRISISEYEGSGSAESSDPFEIAPALREVVLENLTGLPHPLVVPFGQLTYLKADDEAPVAAILRCTPGLEHASFDFNEVFFSGPPISLPRLRNLYISSLGFLSHLILPSLEELYMVDADPAPLLSLLRRCLSIKLRTLRIAFCTPDRTSAILAACPTVKTLGIQIVADDNGNKLVKNLAVRRQGSCMGPNVDSITIGLDRSEIKQDAFVRMVESRWRVPAQGGPCCRLRSIELLINDGMTLSTSTLERLDVLKREGLRVSVLEGLDALKALQDWRI